MPNLVAQDVFMVSDWFEKNVSIKILMNCRKPLLVAVQKMGGNGCLNVF